MGDLPHKKEFEEWVRNKYPDLYKDVASGYNDARIRLSYAYEGFLAGIECSRKLGN